MSSCDLGKTIWKKKHINGANPSNAEPQKRAALSAVILVVLCCDLGALKGRAVGLNLLLIKTSLEEDESVLIYQYPSACLKEYLYQVVVTNGGLVCFYGGRAGRAFTVKPTTNGNGS